MFSSIDHSTCCRSTGCTGYGRSVGPGNSLALGPTGAEEVGEDRMIDLRPGSDTPPWETIGTAGTGPEETQAYRKAGSPGISPVVAFCSSKGYLFLNDYLYKG